MGFPGRLQGFLGLTNPKASKEAWAHLGRTRFFEEALGCPRSPYRVLLACLMMEVMREA
jgi:hypothetical protein